VPDLVPDDRAVESRQTRPHPVITDRIATKDFQAMSVEDRRGEQDIGYPNGTK
jgi:hypothetical protein